MPYVSLSEQQQQFLGKSQANKNPTVKSGYVPLSQQQQTFITTAPKKQAIQQTQIKPVVKSAVKTPIKADGSYTVNGRTFKGEPGTKDFQYPKPRTIIGAGAQQIVKKIKELPLPKVDFADKENFFTPVGFVKHIAQGVINTPGEAIKGTISLTENAVTNKSKPKQVAGDLAAAAQLPLLFVGGGAAKEGLKQTGKQALKQGIKIGAGFGLVTGLQTGEDIKNNNDYVTNLLVNIGIGGATGGASEVAGKYAVPLAKGLSNKLGAVFVKVTGKGKTPVIERIQIDPKIAQNMVLTEEKLAKTPIGKELLKVSFEAKQTNKQIVIQPNPNGEFKLPSGEKIDIGLDTVYEPKKVNDLKITPAASLSEGDRAIEKNFTGYLQDNYDEAIQRYNELPETQGGRVINTDAVRELDSSYINDRTKSAAVHEPASAFTKKMYEDRLKQVDPEGKDLVLFTAGGTGAGKSTAVQGVAPQLLDSAQMIYDTNMSGLKSSIDKIDMALKAKKEVVLAYVYRDPEEALVNGALPRAMRMGRTVPIEEHLKTHIDSAETILKLAEHYKGNNSVDIQIIDNSHGKGQAVMSKLDLLKEKIYNRDELRAKLTSALDKEYEQNRISEQVYKGFSESKPSTAEKTVSTGTGEKVSANNDKGTQSANNAEGGRAATAEPVKESPKPRTIEDYQNPVGTGKLKNSRFFERLKESFGDDIPESVSKENPQYKTLDLEKSAFNAVKIAAEEPERALRIADGLEKAPEGMTTNSMRKTVIEIAREKKDWETFNKYSVKTSLAGTRAGQEIVSFRGKNSDHNPLAYVDRLVKAQKEKIVSRWNDTLLKNYEIEKNASVDTKFKVLVEKQAERVRQKLTVKQMRIQGAQDIINSLICK